MGFGLVLDQCILPTKHTYITQESIYHKKGFIRRELIQYQMSDNNSVGHLFVVLVCDTEWQHTIFPFDLVPVIITKRPNQR